MRASSSPPPGLKSNKPQKSKALVKRRDDYGSDGVKDNDVFLLPLHDYQTMICLTILAAVVRLFRIYQPTSVVFDEVQYATLRSQAFLSVPMQELTPVTAASVASLPSTSRASSSWMSTLL
jgi:dolichyl-phosphate-mannose-protein mannosyltransferase